VLLVGREPPSSCSWSPCSSLSTTFFIDLALLIFTSASKAADFFDLGAGVASSVSSSSAVVSSSFPSPSSSATFLDFLPVFDLELAFSEPVVSFDFLVLALVFAPLLSLVEFFLVALRAVLVDCVLLLEVEAC
jgi:hypothetical protein